MSTKLTGYVWDGCAASGMKLSSVAIMARLADFSNDEGVCWPSIETIARQIGAGMSTVRTAIARLEAEGWLTRKARRQGKHPCEKPADMLRQIINASSRPGDLVADFFMGSGSTIKAAMALGRRALGVELESERFNQTVKEVSELVGK
ncbi:GntR family transcriptional regulator [Escherichia coli]|nr:GntR family transcriptional regulator [Escherichia coli]